MDRAESRRSRHLRRPSRRRTRRTRAAPMVMRCAHHNAEPELMLQSEFLDAGTLCVASDGGWNLGRDKKVRGAAVVVSSTGNSRGSTGARRRPRRRSGPSRPMIRFCLCTTFSLSSGRSARFQTACSQAYYTVFRDSKRPSERHNRRALASRTPVIAMLCGAKGTLGPARQNQEAPVRFLLRSL